jgi:RNA polymerase sigma factor (sigma-70 family)
MTKLPALQVRLLRAFHLERRPVAEIAATMGISERGVEGRLRRARQKLRHEIESDRDAHGESYDY